MTKLQETFVRNLREERRRAGLTQEQAAEKIGITHSYYAAIEGMAKFPSVKKLENIADAFGIPAYRFFADSPKTDQISPAEVIDMYNSLLAESYQKNLGEAKAVFLKALESQSKSRSR